MRNFSKFSKKINFLQLFKFFYFQIFFSFISKPFPILFPMNLNSFSILDSTTHCNKSNAPTCMPIHVATPYDEF